MANGLCDDLLGWNELQWLDFGYNTAVSGILFG